MSDSTISRDLRKREFPPLFGRITLFLLTAGVAVLLGAYLLDARRSAFNNIVLFLFMASLAGGSVFLVALEYIGGAVWSVPMRRVNEFLAGLTPVVPLLALPLLFHLPDVFPWSRPEVVSGDHLLQLKSPYLNASFFVIRFVAVFALWNIFSYFFVRNSNRQDVTKDQRLTTVNIRLAAVFLPVFAITLSITAIDWAMSLEPTWYSTILGVYYFSGTVLGAVALTTYVVVRLHENGFLPDLRRDHFYSLGALMFAFVNFWAYIAFSQFLLIWYANLPEETFWFMNRWRDGWEYVSVLLIVVHFAVPYIVLLPQEAKMDLRKLKFMAVWILFAHLLDIYWLVMPTYSRSVPLSWMELAYPILGVGLIMAVLMYKVKRFNLVPVGDPKLARGLSFRL